MAEGRKVLQAINLASCLMGGTRDSMQSFMAGLASGIAVVYETLGMDSEELNPRGMLEAELLAGACCALERYYETQSKDLGYEALADGKPNHRDTFREKAMKIYRETEAKQGRMPN